MGSERASPLIYIYPYLKISLELWELIRNVSLA